ncbi:hypothetical protein [Andreprevotia chitinilytica]|uniref:COG4648 family protein n=1 Tax=Andreprevotia chitinilytica TaxID=396808 RepID=UPI0005570088|nr:hypothetical protein [Andreprevotia chitinilytica]
MSWLSGLIGLVFPLLFWLFHWLGWPFWLAGLALLPLAWHKRHALPGAGWIGPIALLLGAAALIARSDLPVKLYPVLVNAGLLAVFAASLHAPQTVIERLARLREPDLPESGVRYTRKVTQAWCVFFTANGLIALATVFAPPKIWALYNGLIAYLLIGTMFGIEWLIRRRVRQHA